MKKTTKLRPTFKPFRYYSVVVSSCMIITIIPYLLWPISPSLKLHSTAKTNHANKISINKLESEPSPTSFQELISKVNLISDYSIPPIENGMAPVIFNLPTNQNVVFLGIDDGLYKDQSVVDIMRENNIKASLFLSTTAMADNPDFFKQLVDLGSVVENHTLSHDFRMVSSQTYEQQKAEICGMADYELLHYGRRPTLYRPPGGSYSDMMRRAAADCGIKAIVAWVARAEKGVMEYQTGNVLRPGDIVLMHFRTSFRQDMQAFVDAMKSAGLRTALLEDVL